ncbi:hypothetical protein [Muribaculum intestinale]|uniref:hypothetical protein n=7 Tax=Muribaculum intestinale TaxID=1796646 RepID=UPI001433F214|nr:hypothetical protein [Muribaculum intestinale]GFI66785.1 hypothetical protein IMSAG192_00307 [Muribaculaceae bacterium]
MKHILLIITAILILCISCRGKGASSASSDIRQDSIAAIDGDRSFEFLRKLGIEYESLIAKDDSLPAPSDRDFLLTTPEQCSLLRGVITSDFTLSDTASAYLVSVRQINDNVILCQYKYLFSDAEDVYIATYDTDGHLIDAMFAGNDWDKSELAYNLTDSTELVSVDHTLVYFIGDHEFTYNHEYKEIEHNVNTDKDTTTYSQMASMTCNIEPNGKIDITMEDGYEDGVFRLCCGSGSKMEWKLMNDMLSLTRYPYSDNKVLDRWDDLGNRVDAASSESFVDHFFKYVFLPQPEKVLKWIYNNRDYKSMTLTRPLGFYYTYTPQSRKIIDEAIARLDNPAMQTYYTEMTELWISND